MDDTEKQLRAILAERQAMPMPGTPEASRKLLLTREQLRNLPADRMLTCREIADATGKTTAAIRKAVSRRRLPATHMKGRHPLLAPLLIRAADIQRYLGWRD
jgi:hypothetical protein